MQRLTMKEVQELHGGILPADAMLRPDEETPIMTAPKRQARGERFAVLNAFTDSSMASLKGADVKVWLVLFRDTKKTGTARTGQTDIARRTGLSVRGVQKALKRLEQSGRVQIVRRGRLNAGPTVYRVSA